ncbi:unnamed protein product, partial [Mesorhabditis spiculigera]
MNLTFVPLAAHFWGGLPPLILSLQISSYVLLFILFCVTLKMMRDANLYVEDDMLRRDLCVLLATPFIVATTCVIGNAFPRCGELMYAVGLTYLMGALFRVVDLVYKLFGGRQSFSRWLTANGKRISFATTPMCCCCKCLPEAEPTPRNLQRLLWFVWQSPTCRVLVQLAIIILVLEGVPDGSTVYRILDGVASISALIGVYITHIMLNMTQDYLEKFNMVILFKCVDFGQLFFTLLKLICDSVFKHWNLGYTELMSVEANSLFFFNVFAVAICLILATVQALRIRPGKCALYDTKIAGRHVSIRRKWRKEFGLPDGVESDPDETFELTAL